MIADDANTLCSIISVGYLTELISSTFVKVLSHNLAKRRFIIVADTGVKPLIPLTKTSALIVFVSLVRRFNNPNETILNGNCWYVITQDFLQTLVYVVLMYIDK